MLAAGEGRLAFQVAVFADGGVAFDDDVGADAGLGADLDAAQVQQAAFDARILQIDRVADAGAGADGHQLGHADGHRAQVRIGTHARAEQTQPRRIQRRAVDHVGGRGLGQPVGQPPAVIGDAPQRVAARLQSAADEPPANPGDDEVQPDGHHERQGRHEHRVGDRVLRVAGVEVVDEERRQPLRHGQQHQERSGQPLRDAAAPAAPGAVDDERPFGRRSPGVDHAGRQRLGDQADPAVVVDVGHGGLGEARVLPQRGRDARGEQRVAAQVAEEVQLAADWLAGEQLFERGEQHFLGRRLGQVAALGRRGGGQRLRLQHLAVDLAAGQARHGGQRLEARRHHVRRQLLGQAGAQGLDVRRPAGAGPPQAGGGPLGGQRTTRSGGAWGLTSRHVEGDELVDAIILAQQHRRGAHAGLRRQHGLDLAQLDAEAANLHLVVGAAQALHLRRAVRLVFDLGQIACAVQARFLFVARPGVGQELLGRQLGPSKIAGGHAGAGDAQLAGFAEGQNFQRRHHAVHDAVRVDHLDDEQAVVGQRLANRHRLAGLEFGQRGRHRGLGRAVGVEHLPPRCPLLHQRLRAHLAAQVDDAQARHVLREQRQQRGHGVQHRHVVLDQRTWQRLGVACDLLGRDPQRGADEVADPDLLEAHVEGDGKALVDLVVLAHAEARVLAAQEVRDAALRDGNALGLAGGAAGVDDVGGVAGQRAFAPAQCGALGQRCQQFLGGQDAGRDALLSPCRLAVLLIDQ